MKKYNCDICDNYGNDYYGYNSLYGYCDNKSCQIEARNRLSRDMEELLELDDLEGVNCLLELEELPRFNF